jgi:potassium efflux system protein
MIGRHQDKIVDGHGTVCFLWGLILSMAFASTFAFSQDAAVTDLGASPSSSEPPEPPSLRVEIAKVTAALVTIQGESVPDVEQIKSLQARLLDLTETLAARNRIEQFDHEIATVEERRETLKGQLEAMPETVSLPEISDDLDEAELQAGLEAAQEKSVKISFKLQTVEEQLVRRQSRRVEIRAKTVEIAGRLRTLESDEIQDDQAPQDRIIERYRTELTALERERKCYDLTDDVLRIEQRLWIRHRDDDERTLQVWQSRVANQAIEAAENRREEAVTAAAAQQSELARFAAAQNKDLADRLAGLIGERESLLAELASQKRLLRRVNRRLDVDGMKFNGLVTPEVARILREREAEFPDGTAIAARLSVLNRLRPTLDLERTLLEDALDGLADPRGSASKAVQRAGLTGEEAIAVRQSLILIYEDRLNLYGQSLLTALNEDAEMVSSLISIDEALIEGIIRYREIVLRETLWIRDSRVFQEGHLSRTTEEMKRLFQVSDWNVTIDAVYTKVILQPFRLLLAFGPLVLLLVARNRIASRIALAGIRVARPSTDKFGETLVCGLLAAFVGLAIASPFWTIGNAIKDVGPGDSFTDVLGGSISILSWFVLWTGMVWSITRPGGLGERHFRWKPTTIGSIRAALVAIWIALPFGALDRLCDLTHLDLPNAGQVFYIFLLICLSIAAILLLNPRRGILVDFYQRNPEHWLSAFRWAPSAVVISACCVIAGFAIAGWYATVATLQRHVIASVMLLIGILLLREFLLRLLSCRQRTQAAALRVQEAEGENVSNLEDSLATLSGQILGGIRFAVVLIALVGFWTIWSPLLPALRLGDGIVLWERTASTMIPSENGVMITTPTQVPVSIRDLLRTIALVVATIYTARHLPYLLGLLILDRFRIGQGDRYAVAQILRWAIGIGGLAAAVSNLGVTWDSVQWLAAGFTVGLGFGLQEIFANFISGLIILFEQPVRVGDVVTVGTTTGRISKVRMRATVITDWDNKELLVPNKFLITSEVVNWSQGEASIRLLLPVGVSYNDDPAKVAELLLSAGSGAANVLDDPPPTVDFVGFGENSMNFELRVFIPSVDFRIETRKSINIEVKRLFDEAGIKIPFPQRDVRVELSRPDRSPNAPIADPRKKQPRTED